MNTTLAKLALTMSFRPADFISCRETRERRPLLCFVDITEKQRNEELQQIARDRRHIHPTGRITGTLSGTHYHINLKGWASETFAVFHLLFYG
jgi:hypothetical protein